MKKIMTRQELVDLAAELGVRHDWHEPDEQGITARVFGDSFDNAMGPGYFYGTPPDEHCELTVELKRLEYDDHGQAVVGEPIAQINLATLLAWASQPVQSETTDPIIRQDAKREALVDAIEALQRMARNV